MKKEGGFKVFYGGGLNENQHPHPAEAASGSYNFDLKKDSSYLFPRQPFDTLGTATNGATVRGILQLIKRDDTETTLIQSGDTVYKWDGATTFSAVTTLVTSVSQLRDCYWSLSDCLFVTDLQKFTPISKWDGINWTSGAVTASGVNVCAKYAIVHLGRVWYFNVKTTTDTPHLLCGSKFEDPTSCDTTKRAVSGTFVTGSEAFFMLTPDLKPINGVALFHGDLVMSTEKGRLYRLSGTSATDFKWVDFYTGSNAVGDEAVVDAGNDIHYMRRGGNIERLLATQNYGDVSTDDLSRWIPDTVRDLTDAIAVYDASNQKVLWFITGKVLAFYKDIFFGGGVVDATGAKAPISPWSVYTTAHASNFTVEAARYLRRPGASTYSVYFGDSSGVMYDLNGTGSGDAGNTDITLNRITRFLGTEVGVDYRSRTPKARIEYERTVQCTFNLTASWGDEYNDSTASVTLKGPLTGGSSSYFGGSGYFSGSSYFGGGTSSGVKSHIQTDFVGKGFPVKLTASSTGRVRYHVDCTELR